MASVAEVKAAIDATPAPLPGHGAGTLDGAVDAAVPGVVLTAGLATARGIDVRLLAGWTVHD